MSEVAHSRPGGPEKTVPSWPPVAPEGALAPRFKLPDHGGQSWALGSDLIAGRPIVLIFCPGFDDAANRAQLLGFRDRAKAFAAGQATLVAVTRQTTATNAELLNRSGELGCVKPGALADLIVVEGNPLEDLSPLSGDGEGIPLVMKGGEIHKNQL